jgi:23S rRNA (cytidine1920-2'-O)/16S rRNA (cytidine1409-2'-O)-methyltransferase
MKKSVLLRLLEEQYGLEYSSKELYSRILCGKVFVNGEKNKNPKALIPYDAVLSFDEKKFVSRGGSKLENALKILDFPVLGKTVLDAGSSTGGFTHCLLENGAACVIAVDVGTNQLAWQLRTDRRVIVMEQTDIMKVTGLNPVPDLAVADLSFRSGVEASARILALTSGKRLLALIKPQFETDKNEPAFDGVVRDSGRLKEILENAAEVFDRQGLFVERVVQAFPRGRSGNREYFFLLREKKEPGEAPDCVISASLLE